MPQKRLTDVAIRALQPPAAGQVTYWDRALGVRVSQGGSKTFVVLVGSGKRRAIGRYPNITLADARKQARFYNPAEAADQRFDDALNLFLETRSKQRHRASHRNETKRLLEKHFLPTFRALKLDDIKPHEVSAIIDRLHRTPSEAEHAFKALRTFLTFCFKRGFIQTSPIARLETPRTNGSRERVLDEAELKNLLLAAKQYGYPYGTILTLLVLTGARRGEIANLRRSWVKNDYIIFPAAITKNGREHRFPIGPFTRSILAKLPGNTDLYFLARGKDTLFCGWGGSKGKREFLGTFCC